jgi:biotin-dependent carboxylase-like uncharacterized protein
VLARAGNVLTFGLRRSGCRAYLALAGGIDVALMLGSRSTDLAAGFGGLDGRALRAGDRLAVGPRVAGTEGPVPSGPGASDEGTVRVILGPQDDHFPAEALEAFLGEAYALAPESDRLGCRLRGPRLAHLGAAEIVTDGMVPGSVQVPPDGQPIVMMAGGPTTGGYPKIATVVGADLPTLAQLLPGAGRVRFRAVSVDEVQEETRRGRDL